MGDLRAGIIGWGAYIPPYRIKAIDIANLWGMDPYTPKAIWIEEKAVAGADEDTITIGWRASRYAIERAGIDPSEIGAVFVGTESKPYSVKPSATVIGDALGIPPSKLTSDLEFACRAASEAIRISISLVNTGVAKNTLVIGADTAQASPGDILELTASSGGVALIIGSVNNSPAAIIEDSYTYVTDTPDFWRREHAPYPEHGEAFTGEPAYFDHIINAVKGLFSKGYKPSDFDYAVFHQPNGKFPLQVGSKLGFPREKILPGLVTPFIGNTYNGSALMGLAKVLEEAKPGSRILLAPFGSGAGADAYAITVTDKVLEKRDKAPKVVEMVSRKIYISYAEYSKYRNKILRYPR